MDAQIFHLLFPVIQEAHVGCLQNELKKRADAVNAAPCLSLLCSFEVAAAAAAQRNAKKQTNGETLSKRARCTRSPACRCCAPFRAWRAGHSRWQTQRRVLPSAGC